MVGIVVHSVVGGHGSVVVVIVEAVIFQVVAVVVVRNVRERRDRVPGKSPKVPPDVVDVSD